MYKGYNFLFEGYLQTKTHNGEVPFLG